MCTIGMCAAPEAKFTLASYECFLVVVVGGKAKGNTSDFIVVCYQPKMINKDNDNHTLV